YLGADHSMPPDFQGVPVPMPPRRRSLHRLALGATAALLALPAPAHAAAGWAVVDADGALLRGSHAIQSDRLSAGSYRIRFDFDVQLCAYNANVGLGLPSAGNVPSMVAVSGSDTFPLDGVAVQTKDATGATVDLPFNLVVSCGTAKAAPYAVVGE